MTDSGEAERRPVRAPLRGRSRRRWAIAGGVALCWLVLEVMTGSAMTATVVLVAAAGLGVAAVVGLRGMGITRDHPWLRRMAARPWRDGQDVLNVALRHLPDVFIVTPSGSLIAPDVVELRMSPDDLASLCQQMDFDTVCTSVTEVYEDQVAKRGARFAGAYRPEVYVVYDDSVPQGRYRLQRGVPVGARSSAGPRGLPDEPDFTDRQFSYVAATAFDAAGAGSAGRAQHPAGRTRHEVNPGRTVMDGMPTVMEQLTPAVPVLRLVTGSSAAETATSGARAGRGPVELVLPDVPTVSREHAMFTYAADRWWVTNQGMNGLYVNGVPVSGKQSLSDGDSIRWGTRPDAPLSRVEIG
ncbi:MAG: FHA domain-containing protein [Trebonia sp.]